MGISIAPIVFFPVGCFTPLPSLSWLTGATSVATSCASAARLRDALRPLVVPLLGEHRLLGGNEVRFGRSITLSLTWVGWPSRSSYNDNKDSSCIYLIRYFSCKTLLSSPMGISDPFLSLRRPNDLLYMGYPLVSSLSPWRGRPYRSVSAH
jgi:hypothetical protein